MGIYHIIHFINSFLKLFEAPIKPKSKKFANNPTPVKSALDFLSVSQLASMEGLPENTHEFSEDEMNEAQAINSSLGIDDTDIEAQLFTANELRVNRINE